MRSDKRTNTQLRPISCEHNLIQRSDGSVRYSQGNTIVLAAVYGPLYCTPSRFISPSQAQLQVHVTPCQGSITTNEYTLSSYITSAIAPIVLLHLDPRMKISIFLQILHCDGSLVSALINSSMIALINAGIQCSGIVTAIDICINDPKERQLMIDPIEDEQRNSELNITLAIHSNITKQQQTQLNNNDSNSNNQLPNVLFSNVRGILLNDNEYTKCLHLASRCSLHISHVFKQSIATILKK